MVTSSFEDPSFDEAISLLAYDNDKVIGRIDVCLLLSHFDWISTVLFKTSKRFSLTAYPLII